VVYSFPDPQFITWTREDKHGSQVKKKVLLSEYVWRMYKHTLLKIY